MKLKSCNARRRHRWIYLYKADAAGAYVGNVDVLTSCQYCKMTWGEAVASVMPQPIQVEKAQLKPDRSPHSPASRMAVLEAQVFELQEKVSKLIEAAESIIGSTRLRITTEEAEHIINSTRKARKTEKGRGSYVRRRKGT